MNILHHKSWHVLRKDNLERVMRDEKEAKEKEEKMAAKALLAEQEVRLNLLRSKSQLAPLQQESNQRFNLFQKEEDEFKRSQTHKPNDEYENEKKQKEDKEELKKTTFLGQGSRELSGQTPWYEQTKKKPFTDPQQKILEANDPLVEMQHLLDRKKGKVNSKGREQDPNSSKARHQRHQERMAEKKRRRQEILEGAGPERPPERPEESKRRKISDEKESDSSSSSSSSSSSESESDGESRKSRRRGKGKKDRKHKKDRKQKKSKKERREEEEDERDRKEKQEKQEKLAKLREERMQRELEERKKLASIDKETGTPLDIYRHRYYSQFNPNHAKPTYTPNRY